MWRLAEFFVSVFPKVSPVGVHYLYNQETKTIIINILLGVSLGDEKMPHPALPSRTDLVPSPGSVVSRPGFTV